MQCTHQVADREQRAECESDDEALASELQGGDGGSAGSCAVCLATTISDAANEVLLCDGCDSEVHLRCAGVHEVPEGDWYCVHCVEGGGGGGGGSAGRDLGGYEDDGFIVDEDEIEFMEEVDSLEEVEEKVGFLTDEEDEDEGRRRATRRKRPYADSESGAHGESRGRLRRNRNRRDSFNVGLTQQIAATQPDPQPPTRRLRRNLSREEESTPSSKTTADFAGELDSPPLLPTPRAGAHAPPRAPFHASPHTAPSPVPPFDGRMQGRSGKGRGEQEPGRGLKPGHEPRHELGPDRGHQTEPPVDVFSFAFQADFLPGGAKRSGERAESRGHDVGKSNKRKGASGGWIERRSRSRSPPPRPPLDRPFSSWSSSSSASWGSVASSSASSTAPMLSSASSSASSISSSASPSASPSASSSASSSSSAAATGASSSASFSSSAVSRSGGNAAAKGGGADERRALEPLRNSGSKRGICLSRQEAPLLGGGGSGGSDGSCEVKSKARASGGEGVMDMPFHDAKSIAQQPNAKSNAKSKPKPKPESSGWITKKKSSHF